MKKKYNFLNINPSNNDCIKISHAFALHLSSTVLKQYFLVGESRYQSYVYFQALKRHFFSQNYVYLRKCYS